jgi:hypothetical protein
MATRTDEQKAAQAAKRRRKDALAAEAEHERNEAKRREWEANGTRLSGEELEAGVPCRGCGLPIIDGLGDRPPLLKLTEAERAEFDAADAYYLARHRSCHSHRWSMSGSRTQHCGYCCPPPPLSRDQIEQISRILSSTTQRGPRELATWQLTLTCDHTVERSQHRSSQSWTTRVVECPTCAAYRAVVTSERLADTVVDEPAKSDEQASTRRAQAELAKLRREARTLQERIDKLERTIGESA